MNTPGHLILTTEHLPNITRENTTKMSCIKSLILLVDTALRGGLTILTTVAYTNCTSYTDLVLSKSSSVPQIQWEPYYNNFSWMPVSSSFLYTSQAFGNYKCRSYIHETGLFGFLLCSPSCAGLKLTEIACICLPSAEIKGMHHHAQFYIFLNV